MLTPPLCELLHIKYPIVQGGMAYLGTYELVSAVSNGGGLGVIGCGISPPEWVEEQIRLTRSKTDKPFGVNLMLMSPSLEQVIEVVIKHQVPIVTTGGGNPGPYISRLKEAGIKVIPVVSTLALLKRLERLNIDAVVAEGRESGGHVGDTATLPLIPQVMDMTSVPVIAAGGFADGRGLAAALSLGAQGIQMGTRFICTTECIAHPGFKQQILNAQDRDTTVTGEAWGHPMRCLKNRMTRQFQAMERESVPREVLEEFGVGKLYQGVIEGDTADGSLMAGEIAGLVKEIKPAATIIQEIISQAEGVIAHLHTMLRNF